MSLLTTPLCSRLGIDVPIVQAPVGSAATPELAAAVSGHPQCAVAPIRATAT